jgi:hypothetical protein
MICIIVGAPVGKRYEMYPVIDFTLWNYSLIAIED